MRRPALVEPGSAPFKAWCRWCGLRITWHEGLRQWRCRRQVAPLVAGKRRPANCPKLYQHDPDPNRPEPTGADVVSVRDTALLAACEAYVADLDDSHQRYDRTPAGADRYRAEARAIDGAFCRAIRQADRDHPKGDDDA